MKCETILNMGTDEQNFNLFMHEAIEKAETIASQSHITLEARNTIRDLLQIVAKVSELREHSGGLSADARIMKKRLDDAKLGQRKAEQRIDTIKTSIPKIIEEIKILSLEIGQIAKRHEATPQDADAQSAVKLKSAMQRMADLIILVSQS